MALLRILLMLFVIMQSAFAVSRTTTFEDRPLCEKSEGVWRLFGNGCIDSCLAKIDPYTVCTQALTYGCQCGEGRCWSEQDGCVDLQQYTAKYQEKQRDEKIASDKDRLQRQQEAQDFRRKYVEQLIKGENKQASDKTADIKKEEDENSFTASNKQLIYDRLEGKKAGKKKDLEKKLAELQKGEATQNSPQEKSTIINPPKPITTDSTSNLFNSVTDKFNQFIAPNNQPQEIPQVYVANQNGEQDFAGGKKVIDNLNKEQIPVVPLD